MGADIRKNGKKSGLREPAKPVSKKIGSKKIKLDERFADVFNNPDFKSGAPSVDKRGRKLTQSLEERKLKELYESESSSEDEENVSEDKKKLQKNVEGVYDPARGIGVEESSSEDSGEESDDELEYSEKASEVNTILHNWNFNDDNVPKTDDATSSVLAMCNFDAQIISAQDIYVLMTSFLTLEGQIRSVKVYLSDFGKEKLDLEALEGPVELKKEEQLTWDGNSDDESVDVVAREKVRLYQAQRLRYYYAIIKCSDSDTAAVLYDSCDGLELETSATFIDLRFVPSEEEESFSDKEPIDQYAPGNNVQKYRPNTFSNKSLSHQTPELSWDKTDPRRSEILNKRMVKDDDVDDYAAFLASSSSESESGTDAESSEKLDLNSKRALLLGEDPGETPDTNKNGLKPVKKKKEANSEGDKSITIQLSAEEVQNECGYESDSERADSSESSNDENDDAHNDNSNDEGSDEKRKVKPPSNKNDLELLLADPVEDAGAKHKHFDYNKIIKHENMSAKTKKRKKIKDVDFEFHIDTSDPRFRAVFEKPDFAIDPSDPKFKPTAAMKEIVAKRCQVRSQLTDEYTYKPSSVIDKNTLTEPEPTNSFTSSQKSQLNSLIQNLKSRTSKPKKKLSKN